MRRLFHRVFPNAVGDNPWYLCVEVIWATVYTSAQTFAGAYAIRLGASNSQVSLLSSLPALTAALVLLPAGHFLQSRDRRKNWLLGSLMIARAGTLLYVLLPWMHVGGLSQGTLFVIFFATLSIPAHFFNLGFIPMLAEAIPEHHRADTFAARNILTGAMMSLSTFVFGFWLTRIMFPANYQSLFFFGYILSLVSLYFLSKVKVPEPPAGSRSRNGSATWGSATREWLGFFAGAWKVKEFVHIVVNTFLYSLGLWVATPVLLLYFVRTLGASEGWLGVLSSISSLATIFGYLFWRRVAARWGEPRSLKYTVVAMGLYPLLAGLIPSLVIIPFFAGLNGLIAAGVNLTHFNTFLKVIPEKERHNYTALYLALMNFGGFVIPMLGILLANRFAFGPILVACGLLSIAGSLSFWIWPVGGPASARPGVKALTLRAQLTKLFFFNTISSKLAFRAPFRGPLIEAPSRPAGEPLGGSSAALSQEKPAMATVEMSAPRVYEKYRVSVEQYRLFREQGYLIIKGLIPLEDVQAMNEYMDDMLAGRKTIEGALIMKGFGLKPTSPEDWARAHMLHRLSPLHERFLLHPRVLDGLEALIGPDVLALQSMLFFKQPGQPGQGYHQDSYYLPTFPDTLCGAWQALTPATLENGCLWFATGSQNEPVYPDPRGGGAALSANIGDLGTIDHPSVTDEAVNGLTRVAKKYAGKIVPVEAEPGDVVFFGGHVLHWSHGNHSNAPRRSFVGHYCNARSLVKWNHGEPWEGDSANYLHILARGDTHLPYAQPKFGTPCAANTPRPQADGAAPATSMMGMDDDMMGPGTHPDEPDHE